MRDGRDVLVYAGQLRRRAMIALQPVRWVLG